MFEDENLNQKKSAWARMLLFLKDLTHVMKKSQKYLPINFSKGTFFYKDRWKPFWPILTGNEWQMSLLCTCVQECLMKGRPRETRLMIQQLRQRLLPRNYNEQNYIRARQMEVKVCPSGVRKITYNVLPLGKVCRDAFQKCYGISNAKINVLLKKMDVDGVSIQPDMRGRHEPKTTKLLQKREVR